MIENLKLLFWNPNEKRLRAGYRIILAVILFFILYKGYLFILKSAEVKLYYSDQTSLWVFLVAGTIRLIPAIIVLFLGGKFLDKRNIKDFGLILNRAWIVDLLFGLGLGAFLMLLIFLVELGLGWISVSEFIHHRDSESSFLIPLMVFLFYIACQGAFEELLFRGYTLKNLAEGFNSKKIGPKWAVIVAWLLISGIFGLGHLGNPDANIISTTNLLVIGIIFGAGIVLTGRLAIPIGLHISWNFFQGNIFGYPISGLTYPANIVSIFKIDQHGPELWTGGKFGPEAGLLGLFVCILGLILIFIWSSGKNKFRINTSVSIFKGSN